MSRGPLRVWEGLPLRWKSVVLALVPFVVLLMSASYALWGNSERQRTETALARHVQMVFALEETQTLVVNAETGVRGFLLTRRSEFLSPFLRAQTLLPARERELQTLVATEPGEGPRQQKTARLARIKTLLSAQMADLNALRRQTNSSPARLLPLLLAGRDGMVELRRQLRQMRDAEQSLMNERLSDIASVRRRDYLGIALTLLVGIGARALSIYLFNTGINARLKRVQSNLRALLEGQRVQHQPTPSPDALGELEREVAAAFEETPRTKIARWNDGSTGQTTFAIMHRLSTVLNAEQILVLECGRSVECSTHAQLLSMNGAYARLYAAQFENKPLEVAPIEVRTFPQCRQ